MTLLLYVGAVGSAAAAWIIYALATPSSEPVWRILLLSAAITGTLYLAFSAGARATGDGRSGIQGGVPASAFQPADAYYDVDLDGDFDIFTIGDEQFTISPQRSWWKTPEVAAATLGAYGAIAAGAVVRSRSTSEETPE